VDRATFLEYRGVTGNTASLLEYVTTPVRVGIISNMSAELLLDERHVVVEDAFVAMDDFWNDVDHWRH